MPEEPDKPGKPPPPVDQPLVRADLERATINCVLALAGLPEPPPGRPLETTTAELNAAAARIRTRG